jgi:hypothetical protein
MFVRLSKVAHAGPALHDGPLEEPGGLGGHDQMVDAHSARAFPEYGYLRQL